MPPLSDYPDLLKATEACEITRIGNRQMYALINSGEIPAIRLGNSWRIPKARLIAYLGLEEE
jgi:excisionase family DNA binding protein